MRYYFHLRAPDRYVEDMEGLELDGIDAVRREAADGARDIIADRLRAARQVDLDILFEVRDESGDLVHRVSFRDALSACLTESGGTERIAGTP